MASNNIIALEHDEQPLLTEEVKENSLQLGRALIIAEKHFKELKNSTPTSTPLKESLNTLHILLNKENQKQTANEIVESILNRLPKTSTTKKSNYRQNPAFNLFCYLIETYKIQFTKTFLEIYSKITNKNQILQLTEFFNHILDQQQSFLKLSTNNTNNNSKDEKKLIQETEKINKIPPSIYIYHQLFISLFNSQLHVAEKNSISKGNKIFPTRLSLFILNFLWKLTKFMASFDRITKRNSLLQNVNLIKMIHLYLSYHDDYFPLFSLSLQQISDNIPLFQNLLNNDQKKDYFNDIIHVFCLQWEEYSEILLSHSDKKSKLSKSLQKSLIYYLKQLSIKEIQNDENLLHHNLLCICLIISPLKSLESDSIQSIFLKYPPLETLQKIIVSLFLFFF